MIGFALETDAAFKVNRVVAWTFRVLGVAFASPVPFNNLRF
jgi:hypothetical protein